MKRFEPYKEDDGYDSNKMIPVKITELNNLGFKIVFDPPVEFMLYEEPDEKRFKTLATEILTSMGYELDENGIEPSIKQEVVYTTDELDKLGVFEFNDEVGLEDCPFCNQENEVPESLLFHNIKCSNCGEIKEIGPSDIVMSRNLTYLDMKDKRRN